MSRPARTIRVNLLAWLFVLAAAFLMLAPIVIMFFTAFKPDGEILHFASVLPKKWTLENFHLILTDNEEIPIFRWFANSMFIATMVTFLVLLVDSMAAYALARLRLPGTRLIFFGIIATMMVPGQILLIPVYVILDKIGWIDTPWALIVPPVASAFGVFLLYQFFLGIPRELEEAAAVDGCSRLRTYWEIILPLSKPALSTLGIFVFIASWNDFLAPMVYLDSVDKYTLPIGITLFQTAYYTEYGITISASVLCTLPVLLVYLFFQKHIIKSVAMSGLKD